MSPCPSKNLKAFRIGINYNLYVAIYILGINFNLCLLTHTQFGFKFIFVIDYVISCSHMFFIQKEFLTAELSVLVQLSGLAENKGFQVGHTYL